MSWTNLELSATLCSWKGKWKEIGHSAWAKACNFNWKSTPAEKNLDHLSLISPPLRVNLRISHAITTGTAWNWTSSDFLTNILIWQGFGSWGKSIKKKINSIQHEFYFFHFLWSQNRFFETWLLSDNETVLPHLFHRFATFWSIMVG